MQERQKSSSFCGMGLDLLRRGQQQHLLQWLQTLGAQEMQWAQALDKGPWLQMYTNMDVAQGCTCTLIKNPIIVIWSTGATAGLGGSVGCTVRLETRRSRVQPMLMSATFFHGDWSWNIFYGHSLPSTDSRRAVVSFWRKNVHNTG